MGINKQVGFRFQNSVRAMFDAVCAESSTDQTKCLEALMWHYIQATPAQRIEISRAWALSRQNEEGIWREFEARTGLARRDVPGGATEEPLAPLGQISGGKDMRVAAKTTPKAGGKNMSGEK